MRFLQIRSKENSDKCYNNSKINEDKLDTNKENCFSEKFEVDELPISFDCESILFNEDKEEIKYLKKDKCNNGKNENLENKEIDPCDKNDKNIYNPLICEIFEKGLKYRDVSWKTKKNETVEEYFVYNSDLKGKYYEKKANYFDIDYKMIRDEEDKNINQKRLKNFSNFLFHSWIDDNTRILVISFNCYQTSSDQDSIFSVTLYLEFSKTKSIKKKFELLFFQKYIESYSLDNISKRDFISLIYFLFLFLYSSINLYYIIKKLRNENDRKDIKRELIVFIINFSLNSLIFVVFLLRLISLFREYVMFKPYLDNDFQEYFPIPYYKFGFIETIKQLEQIMICGIVLNILNSFYFEFFARIFLTFKFAWRYLFAYFICYFLIIIAYAGTCNILYGSYLTGKFKFIKFNLFFTIEFSTFPQSIITMILMNLIELNLLNEMISYYPFASKLLIFSYYFIFYFTIVNMVFVIFLRAYEKVKEKEAVSLLKFNLIYEGAKNYFTKKMNKSK